MKILIHSNGPHVPSGYGHQARYAGKILRDLGHEVAFSCFSGLGGSPIKWEGYTLFPSGALDYGVDVITGHALTSGADLVMPLMDLWKLIPAAKQFSRTGIPMAAFVIADCDPLGRNDLRALQAFGALPVAVSEFGVSMLEREGYEDVAYLPHCYDPKVYRPPADRAALRAELGMPGDAYLIGICAANNDVVRKGFPEQFAGFAKFAVKHSDARLAVLSVADHPRGLNLPELAWDMGIADKVTFMPSYEQVAGLLPEELMAAWYGSLDLLSGCSYAEAFGIPLVQAQACGTPVVATKGSAMTELAVDAGFLVPGTGYWNPVHRGWWQRPDVAGITRAYDRAYQANCDSRRMRAVEAAAPYSMDAVRGNWQGFLYDLTPRIPVAGKHGTVTYGGLHWKAGDRGDMFGDRLALGHEEEFYPEIIGRLTPDSVFLDVGAHVGHWTVRAAKACEVVLAVEADPQTAKRLQENVDLNNLGNVRVWPFAAWDKTALLRLNSKHGYDHDGTNRVTDDLAEEAERDEASVPAYALDPWLLIYERLDMVKIDVEGADLHVLRGMRESLARFRPVLFIEDHSVYPGMPYTHEELVSLLDELDYDIRLLTAKGSTKPTHLIATHR